MNIKTGCLDAIELLRTSLYYSDISIRPSHKRRNAIVEIVLWKLHRLKSKVENLSEGESELIDVIIYQLSSSQESKNNYCDGYHREYQHYHYQRDLMILATIETLKKLGELKSTENMDYT